MPVEIHYNDIQNTIKKIRNDCSTDFDVVSVGLIKPVANSSALTHIVNNCIRQGVSEDCGKLQTYVQYQNFRHQMLLLITGLFSC